MKSKVKELVYLCATALFSLLAFNLSAQGYKIGLKIKGAANLAAQFAYYQGDKQYVVTNDKFDKNGQQVFEGKENLPSGIYFIVVGKLGCAHTCKV